VSGSNNSQVSSNSAPVQKVPVVTIGGQAVIEGVMMRAPGCIATAVRVSDDKILVSRREYESYAKRYKILSIPVFRGAVSLIESLYLGTQTLNWSAEIAQNGEIAEDQGSGLTAKLFAAFSMLLAFALGMGLFMYLPYMISELMGGDDRSQVIFHLLVGLVRISILIGYLWAISQWDDVSRLFAYHGAEHKSIFAYEESGHLCVDNAKHYSRFHPRCGTSFLLIVAASTVLVYALFDTFWVGFYGDFRSVFHRLLVHLPIIPLVAGLSFEVLQFSNKLRNNWLGRLIVAPGMWFQRLTTREPGGAEIEVAIVAIRASLHQPVDDLKSCVEFQ
jgi:uncharacterized protein YqhQ